MQGPSADESRVRVTRCPWGIRVELAAPQVRNALDPPAVHVLLDVFTRDEPGAVLLSATGPAFCAGGDLSVLSGAAAAGDLAAVLTEPAAAFADLVEAVLSCPRPVVAAIDGPAVGGGVSLALACDVRLVTPRARLVLGWARWGLPPDGGAAALLAAVVGAEVAETLLAEAAELDPTSPLAPALFTRVVGSAELDDVAVATATALGAAPDGPATKAATVAPVLAAVREGRQAEMDALARAAAEPTVVARLANIYKMEK